MTHPAMIKIEIPRNVVVDAILAQLNKQGISGPLVRTNGLPEIGEEWEGGLYSGLTLFENRPHALILLPGDNDDANWDAQVKWAENRAASCRGASTILYCSRT